MSIDSSEPSPQKPAGGEGTPELRKVVHDLRNVVAPLRNVVQLLRLRSKTDDQLAPITDIVERQVNAMLRLIQTLADIERPGAAHSAPVIEAPEKTESEAGRRVLIVDDNVALLTSLSSVLREAGHGVKTAEDGDQALKLAESWRPEFVLLDADMPRMNGFEVARQLRASYSRDAMALVLMSGSTLDEATRRGAERAGFDHCIDKIHSFNSLNSLLRAG